MGFLTSLALAQTERDKQFFLLRSVAHYLLRDGTQMNVASDPSSFDVFTYRKPSGEAIHAALSIKAERAILRSVDLGRLVELSHASPVFSSAGVA